MTTALISHRDCILHEISPGHPECPQRIDAVNDELMRQALFDLLQHAEAPLADKELLLHAHGAAYIDSLFDASPKTGSVQLDPDTAMNPHTLDACLRGVGAGVLAVDQVLAGTVDNAFCLVRPPGHHAERNQAMGFCFFGNIAIAAWHALKQHGLERVAIVDFDVHHGNGTEDIVDGDKRILFCSSFQHPFYPGNYRVNVTGQRQNVPLSAGCNSAEFRHAITQSWLPALESFQPEMILISAGFDAHIEDPLAGLALLDSDFVWITTQLMDMAERHANGRIVSMLEGGYALPALARSATAHVRGLMGLT
ncbi:MAG: histone deacetylase family protein [Granulosicoccus sp.]